jgi:hypothetical protein
VRYVFMMLYAAIFVLQPHFVFADPQPAQPTQPPPGLLRCPDGNPPLRFEQLIARMQGEYGEVPMVTGLESRHGAFVMLFATPDGSTWSSVAVNPANRLACIMGVGTAFQILPQGDKL